MLALYLIVRTSIIYSSFRRISKYGRKAQGTAVRRRIEKSVGGFVTVALFVVGVLVLRATQGLYCTWTDADGTYRLSADMSIVRLSVCLSAIVVVFVLNVESL